jgi:hypothetical protein
MVVARLRWLTWVKTDQDPFSSRVGPYLPSRTGLEASANELTIDDDDDSAAVAAPAWTVPESTSLFYADTTHNFQAYSRPPSTTLQPHVGQRILNVNTSEPWSPFNAHNPAVAVSSVANEYIDPSLLQTRPEEHPSRFIGLPHTGPASAQPHSTWNGPLADECEAPSRPTPAANAKTSKSRTRISREALAILESHYAQNLYRSPQELAVIATLSKLELKTVKYWFDNKRRYRRKRKGKRRFSGFRQVSILITCKR